MRFYISYFYNIRFFPENLVPVSTAKWDPTWYHDSKGNNHIYLDKRRVINGVRCNGLSPYKINNVSCNSCDKTKYETCSFLKDYKKYLDSLDFNIVKSVLEHEISKLKKDADICLIVHEAPSNPCSERGALVQWFKENGVILEEWHK